MEYGCIAEKLSHSFSAEIHKQLFDYDYELREIPKGELDSFMRDKNFKAINVTIPYKQDVIPYLDTVSDIAKKIGAVNTIVNDNGRLSGYNTDFQGMCALIKRAGISIEGKKVLVLGSGGTSKTAKIVAEYLGCSAVYRVSRSAKNDCITYKTALSEHSDAQIIINTTPVGMYPNIGDAPIDISDYKRIEAVVDAVYNPLRSKLVCDAREKGIKAVGGLYMLVAQAAYAAEKFTGISVSEEKIEKVYRNMVGTKQNVVLIGMPGCGKSTIGKLLAKELSHKFIDTDDEIVKKMGKDIPAIFAEVGESGFRKIESEVIKEVSSVQNSVIATGGGAILNKINVDLLRENGRIYFIDRSLDKIVATSDRPLSSNRADLEKRYKERYDIYLSSCDNHIKAGDIALENMMIIKKDFCNEDTCD